MKEEEPKVASSAKQKVRHFETSTPSQKQTFKDPTPILKDKVFYFIKQKNSTEFVNNYEAIYNYITVNYNYGGPKWK